MLLKRLPSLSDPFLDGSGQAALRILSQAPLFAQGDFKRLSVTAAKQAITPHKSRSLLFDDTERYYAWLAEEVGLAHFFSWGQ